MWKRLLKHMCYRNQSPDTHTPHIARHFPRTNSKFEYADISIVSSENGPLYTAIMKR